MTRGLGRSCPFADTSRGSSNLIYRPCDSAMHLCCAVIVMEASEAHFLLCPDQGIQHLPRKFCAHVHTQCGLRVHTWPFLTGAPSSLSSVSLSLGGIIPAVALWPPVPHADWVTSVHMYQRTLKRMYQSCKSALCRWDPNDEK